MGDVDKAAEIEAAEAVLAAAEAAIRVVKDRKQEALAVVAACDAEVQELLPAFHEALGAVKRLRSSGRVQQIGAGK